MTYDRNLNYCSWSADGLFGVKFNRVCYLHDRQYRNEVKVRKTRLEADRDLRDGIFADYDSVNKRFLGFIISRIYYYAVRVFCGGLWK